MIDLFPDEKGVRLILSGGALFGSGAEKFARPALPFIDHLGEILKAQKKPIAVEGHVPPGSHGAFASTWDLASARAVNFVRYVPKKYAMPEKGFAVSTFGDSRPLAAKNGSVRENDRLEVLIYFNDAEF